MSENSLSFDGQHWTNSEADAVQLADPDLAWPDMFAAEVATIRKLLGKRSEEWRFEHIGSTAVPGLIAKPIIDLLIILPDGDWPRDILAKYLPSLGYVFWEGNPDPWHLFFVKDMPPFGPGRTHYVHVRPAAQAAPVIIFRDYLRTHPEAAEHYAKLERKLAAAYPHDRGAYGRGKDAFVEDVLQKAAAKRNFI